MRVSSSHMTKPIQVRMSKIGFNSLSITSKSVPPSMCDPMSSLLSTNLVTLERFASADSLTEHYGSSTTKATASTTSTTATTFLTSHYSLKPMYNGCTPTKTVNNHCTSSMAINRSRQNRAKSIFIKPSFEMNCSNRSTVKTKHLSCSAPASPSRLANLGTTIQHDPNGAGNKN